MIQIFADGMLLYYPSDENHNVISPKLTLEMGKAGSLSFGLPVVNAMYDQLRELVTVVTVEWDGVEMFRGRVLSQPKTFDNTKNVYCEGDLAYLVDSVQKPEAYKGTVHDLFRRIIEAHNARMEPGKRFLVGRISVENREIVISGQNDSPEEFDWEQIAINSMTKEWMNTYDYLTRCLIDNAGGYLRTRRENGSVYIDYLSEGDAKAEQTIEFGINLLDLQEEAAEDIFTVLIPVGDDNLTIASVNGGSDELVNEAAVAKYGKIYRTQVFDNVTEPSTLLENGRRYLQNNAIRPITRTIKAVDLHLLNPGIKEIHIGESVHVKSAPHELIDDLTCTKIDFDLEDPSNNEYTFGTPSKTLTQRYREDIAKTAETAEAAASAGAGRAAGGSGGAAQQKAEEDLKKFFDAYIDVDPDAAHITLRALSEIMDGTRKVLTDVGIDLDGVTGNVNIRSLKSKTDELTGITSQQSARIDLLQEETASKISLVTSYVGDVSDMESKHYAELTLKADALESSIGLKADRITLDAKVIELNGKISQINADIANVRKLIADEIAAMKGDISWLNAKYILTSGTVRGGNVVADHNMQIGGQNVATQQWVKNQGYLTGLPSTITATTIKATSSMSIGVFKVATEYWVNEKLKSYASSSHSHSWDSITGKPSRFTPSSHSHSFSGSTSLSWGHTHSNNGKGGVNNYKEKKISISGTTGGC